MGNTEAVAKKSYLQVTDEHFACALETAALQVAHNAAHQIAQTIPGEIGDSQPLVLQEEALTCEDAQNRKVAEEGLEPPTRGL